MRVHDCDPRKPPVGLDTFLKVMEGDPLQKRPLTPGYVFFYLIFLPDTWQILIALIAAVTVTPHILTPDVGPVGTAIVQVMIAGNVYAITGPIGRRISRFLQKRIVQKNHSK